MVVGVAALTKGPHPDEAYVTAGQRYLTPSHPSMIEALGRAMWNVLALEEQVVAILHEAGATDWKEARQLEAGPLEQRLRRLGSELVDQGAGPGVSLVINEAADAFGRVRRRYRNALAHAHVYMAGRAPDGRYLPGLTHQGKNGLVKHFPDPQSLLEVAHEAETAIQPLGEAQIVVRVWRGAAVDFGS
jgi:hypothetical protein